MSDRTLQTLEALAEGMSTSERKVSPMQVAAQLLEEALSRLGEGAPATVHDGTGEPTGKGVPSEKAGTGRTPKSRTRRR
jgi:hypothetical protein